MKERIFDLLLGGLAGFVLAAGLSLTCFDRQMRELQTYSHRVALNAAVIAGQARERADSLRQRADSLERRRLPVIRQIAQDTAAANLANRSLASARTMRDTNVALRLENAKLRGAVVNLWVALQQSEQIIAAERQRGDSLGKALASVNFSLQEVNARVQSLKPPPKLLRVAWRVVELGGVAYLGYQLGRRDRADVQPVTTVLRCRHGRGWGPCP